MNTNERIIPAVPKVIACGLGYAIPLGMTGVSYAAGFLPFGQ